MDLETGCEQPKIRREAYQLVQTTTSHRGLHSNIANTHHRLVSLFAPPFYFSIIIPISPSLADRLSCRRGPFSLFLFFYTLSLMDSHVTALSCLFSFLTYRRICIYQVWTFGTGGGKGSELVLIRGWEGYG